MGSFEQWAGRAREISITADFRLSSRIRVQRITGQSGSPSLILPDARRFWSTGGPVLVVWNTSGADLTIVDHDGGAVVDGQGNPTTVVGDNEAAKLFLLGQADAAGEWIAKIDPTDGVPIGGINDFMFTLGGQDSTYFQEAWQYDQSIDSWVQQSNAPDIIIDSWGGVDAGIGYVGVSLSPFETLRYDPDVWTTRVNQPVNGSDRAGAGYNGTIEAYGLLFGTRNRHDRYSVGGDSWSVGTVYPANFRFGSSDLMEDDAILCHGGTNSTFTNWSATQQARLHTPSLDSFASRTNMTAVGRAEHAHFVLGGDVFITGGQSNNLGSVVYDSTYSYELAGDAWTVRANYSAGTRTLIGGAGRAAGVGYCTGGQGAIDGRSYQIDTWSAIADHGNGPTQYRGHSDSTLALVV